MLVADDRRVPAERDAHVHDPGIEQPGDDDGPCHVERRVIVEPNDEHGVSHDDVFADRDDIVVGNDDDDHADHDDDDHADRDDHDRADRDDDGCHDDVLVEPGDDHPDRDDDDLLVGHDDDDERLGADDCQSVWPADVRTGRGRRLQNEDASTQAHDLSVDAAAGAKWLRVDINWAQIQDGGPSSYAWGPIDAVVQGAEANGMSVLGVIVYTPGWDRPAGSAATYGPSPSSYAAFASAAVAHYSALGVNAYEIWNEENISASWTPAPSPSAYAALLESAYPAIKAADPSATVVSGGLSPAVTDGTNYAPADFLSDVYASGAGADFDAVGMHPYCWPANPGDPEAWSAWYQMYGTSTSVRSVMIANGNGGKLIWATEYGAPTSGPAGTFMTQAQQAQMISDAYALWSSYSWAGPLLVYQGRDQGTDTSSNENFYGLLNNDFTPKPAYAAYQNAVAQY